MGDGMLKEKDITRFIKLYEARFGIELDHDTAQEKLSLLVRQMEVVYRPITQRQTDEYVNGKAGIYEQTRQTG